MNSSLRSLLAIVLSVGVLVLWYTVIAPPPKETKTPVKEQKETVEQDQGPFDKAQGRPGTRDQGLTRRKAPSGEKIILENQLVRVELNTEGGVITGWVLKDYARNGEGLVALAEEGGGILGMDYGPTAFSVKSKSASSVEMTGRQGELLVSKHFYLKENSYQLEVEWEVKNLGSQTVSFQPSVEWGKQPVEESPQRGVLFFKTPPDRWHPLYYQGGKVTEVLWERAPAEQKLGGRFDWMGAQSRYFLGLVIPVGAPSHTLEAGKYQVENGGDYFYQKLLLPPAQALPGERWAQKFLVYGGPKDYKGLKAILPGLEKTLGLGWTTLVAVPMLYLLKFFYNIVRNYGVAIILLTVLVKILLNPINRKSLESMKGMQAIQPRLKELREKYGNDKQKLNQEMMQLFKNNKINPMGGCLPMVLQIPIYIALYKVLWSSVELYHAPFFWFYKDLSAPDPYLVTPILLGITMFIQTKMTPTASVDPMQQKMMLMMPLMFCLFMVFLPMGLGLYILVNTLMTILQQWMHRNDIRMRDVVLGRVFGR